MAEPQVSVGGLEWRGPWCCGFGPADCARHHRPAPPELACVAVGGVARDGSAELRDSCDPKKCSECDVVFLGKEALRLEWEGDDGVAGEPEDVGKLKTVESLRVFAQEWRRNGAEVVTALQLPKTSVLTT